MKKTTEHIVFRTILIWLMATAAVARLAAQNPSLPAPGVPEARVEALKNLRFGMFVCWSFSTFSGREWTPGVTNLELFAATRCDTDQWAKTAKEAGMGYILFLTKHHDGFCFWDTKTTDRKITKAPLGRDVLADVRKSCAKYGLKLALYFSEGEFPDNRLYHPGGFTPEMKKAQLQELLTQYGPVEFIWFDHAQGDGGLNHEATAQWVKRFQPDCFVGFNSGDQTDADIRLGEMGHAAPLTDSAGAGIGARSGGKANHYRLAEFTYPILPAHEGGAMWFYSLPKFDELCLPAEKIYEDYLGAVKHGNIFSLDVGPDYNGRLRDIDVKTLRQVGRYIRGQAVAPPSPVGALPSARQLAWHQLEFFGFCHFTVDTFTGREWGLGSEPESVFNPTNFDADQIVRAFQSAGMKQLILTCKHHDGFCLWPSKFTEHSVKNSTWKNGRGDVVREISDACRKYGLKFGIYLSPWDRNSALYGQPEYLTYYRNQLRELLTNYGPISEVWLDGANGGSGYYGGANETRTIDKKVYYDWPTTWKLIHELQPGAMIFSDVGPDCRWVGNESGVAGDPCWATINTDDWCPGNADASVLNHGVRDGKKWIPAEADVSIRPGWFWHADQNDRVRSAADLWQHYFETVGRGAALNLNVPPDSDGQIYERDVKTLAEFGRIVEKTFAVNLAKSAKVTASNVRGGDPKFSAQNLLDGDLETYWATDDSVTTPEVTLEFTKPVTFNIVSLREFLPLGQRIGAFALDEWKDGQWVQFAAGTSIGSHRLWRGDNVTTEKVRLRITQSPVCPALTEFGLFQDAAAK